MAITADEIRFYKAATGGDGPASGGVQGPAEVVDGLKNSLFPDVSQTERASGIVRRRKCFAHVANAAGLTLYSARAHLFAVSPGEDRFSLAPGTQEDTLAERTGAERAYGVAELDVATSAGAPVLSVRLKTAEAGLFQTGDTIWVGDPETREGEYHAGVTLSGSGDLLTINLADGDALLADHAAGHAVAAVFEAGDVAASATAYVIETAGDGDYDIAGQPVVTDNLGTVRETWTLTFSSSTDYAVAGERLGALAAGSALTDYAHNNPETGTPYFTLRAAGFSGTWAAGDSLGFTTSPASLPLWITQTVDPGAASSESATGILVSGESS